MLEPDGIGAVVRHGEVPVWEKAAPLAADGCYPGGLVNNRDYIGDAVTADGVTREDLLPLYDPQTSGGLLISVAEERRDDLVHALEGSGTLAAVVGEVVEEPGVRVVR